MKTFEEYRAIIGGKGNKQVGGYKYKPKTKSELVDAIENEIEAQGPDADLNCIDTSLITDMSSLFDKLEYDYAKDFNGDVSRWDVSNVTDMSYMFYWCSKFNADISKWNTSKVEKMPNMFQMCKKFNQSLSNWDVSGVTDMAYMFSYCDNFNQDLSGWNVSNVTNIKQMFYECPIKEEYKPKFK